MNNLIIEYKSALEHIEGIIEFLKEANIKASDFEIELNTIKSDVMNSLSEFSTVGYTQKNSIDNIYKKGIEKANILLEKIKKYSDYFEIKNKCYFLEGAQNLIEFDEDKLDTIVDNVIEFRKKAAEVNDYMDFYGTSLDNLYEAMYTIMKMEFSIKGKSKLFDYCQENISDSYMFKRLINEDIRQLKERKYDISEIESIMLNESDLFDYQLDEDLVLLVSLTKNKDKYIEDLTNSLSEYIRTLVNNKESIRESIMSRDYYQRSLDDIGRDYGKYGNSKAKLILLNAFPCALIILPVVGAHIAAYTGIVGVEYETETQTYSAQTGKTIDTVEYANRLLDGYGNNIEDVVYVESINPWEVRSSESSNDTYFERKIEKTAIKGVEYDDLSKYLELDLMSLGDNIEYSVDVERKPSLTASDMYAESTEQVVKIHQDSNNHKTNDISVGWKIGYNALILLFDCVVLLVLSMIPSGRDKKIIDNLFNIIYGLQRFKRDEEETNEQFVYLKKRNDAIKDLLENNEEVKRRYLALKNDPRYKFYIDEFDQKMSQIDELLSKMEDTKVLSLK